MTGNLTTALNELERAFGKSTKDVTEATAYLNNTLSSMHEVNLKEYFNKEDISKMINTIEKLSIQNDYKLSILKDFPKYISYKKQL